MNLIICTTPFQVLLAEKIFEKRPDEEYIFRYISLNKNNKTDYYYSRLANRIVDSEFIHVDVHSGIELVVFCLQEKMKSLFRKKYNSVSRIILGSIDNNHIHIHIHIHNIIKNNDNIVIETFDDGTANIHKNSFFYRDTQFSKKMKVLRWFLCRGTDMNLLKSKDVKHYSVYKDKENIIENVEYLPLFSYEGRVEFDIEEKSKVEKIFLGQPIYEMDITRTYTKEKHQELVNKLLSKLNIDYFIPHPREDNYLLDKDKYLNTEKIFEDFFFDRYDPSVNYKLYTFFSGAVLSLVSLPNVEVNIIKINDFPTNLNDIYHIVQDFNVKVVEVTL